MKHDAKQYLTDLTVAGLLLLETRVVAESLLDKPSEATWRKRITEGNILQKKSDNTAMRYALMIKRRISPLGQDFLSELSSTTGQVYIQLTLLSAMLHTPAIPDFMALVIADARRQYKTELPPFAWRDFIAERSRVFPGLSQVSDSSISKCGTNIVRILVEAGYLETNKNKKFQPVYILPETTKWLQKLDRQDLEEVMECTL